MEILTKDGSILLEQLELGPIQTNCYIVTDQNSKQTVVVDPGGSYEILKAYLDEINKKYGAKVVAILNTHGHWDHIGANARLQAETGAKIYIHPLDAAMLQQKGDSFFGVSNQPSQADVLFEDGQKLQFGGLTFQVIHTPGHTPGGVGLLLNNEILFAGDTLFQYSIGRTDLKGGDFPSLIRSIKEKLFSLADDVLVLPGHGPSTTIGAERKMNPFTRE